MSVTYTAVLDVSEDSVLFLSGCCMPSVYGGVPARAPALGTYKQAVLVLRWFLDDTRMSALARDNDISVSTAYEYRDEGIAVLAARQPSLHGALLAAKAAGHSHVIVDGTLIHTDRISTPGPTAGWTCGGAASTTITAGTSRSSPPRTGGHCGPPASVRAGSTT